VNQHAIGLIYYKRKEYKMIELVVSIAIIGVVVWCIVTLIPMPSQFKTAIVVIAVVCVVIYVLRAFGLFTGGYDLPCPTCGVK